MLTAREDGAFSPLPPPPQEREREKGTFIQAQMINNAYQNSHLSRVLHTPFSSRLVESWTTRIIDMMAVRQCLICLQYSSFDRLWWDVDHNPEHTLSEQLCTQWRFFIKRVWRDSVSFNLPYLFQRTGFYSCCVSLSQYTGFLFRHLALKDASCSALVAIGCIS